VDVHPVGAAYRQDVSLVRRPTWADVVLPGGLALLGLVEAARASDLSSAPVWPATISTLMSVALVWRQAAPLPASAVVATLFLLYPAVDPGAGESLVQAVALLVSAYAVAARAMVRPAIAGLVLLTIAGVARSVLMDYDVSSVAANAIWAPIAWGVGRVVHERDRRASMAHLAAAATQELRDAGEREAASAERRRIARELHDVVAHAVTVIVVQARGARRQLDANPEEARSALDAIEVMASEAIDELRRMLALLDDPDDGLVPDAVRSGPAELRALVDRVRAAGLAVELDVTGEPAHRVTSVDVSAYRVVQEALTNALRHGSRTPAHVVVSYHSDRIDVRVDSGVAQDSEATVEGTGRGLVGLRERVRLTGGSLDVGVDPRGRYALHAVLPFEGQPA
jgi:signal transduction histidine kinase